MTEQNTSPLGKVELGKFIKLDDTNTDELLNLAKSLAKTNFMQLFNNGRQNFVLSYQDYWLIAQQVNDKFHDMETGETWHGSHIKVTVLGGENNIYREKECHFIEPNLTHELFENFAFLLYEPTEQKHSDFLYDFANMIEQEIKNILSEIF